MALPHQKGGVSWLQAGWGLPWEGGRVLRAGKDARGVGGANCQTRYTATWRICYPLVRLCFPLP